MNKAIFVKLAAAAAVVALAGCVDLKPLQAQVDTLKSQTAALQTDLAANKAEDDKTMATADPRPTRGAHPAAASAAAAAQSTANQALAAAQASQSGVDATNEKIDRMFKKSVSK